MLNAAIKAGLGNRAVSKMGIGKVSSARFHEAKMSVGDRGEIYQTKVGGRVTTVAVQTSSSCVATGRS